MICFNKALEDFKNAWKFGYYDDSADVNPLLPSIHKLLDGSGDYPTNPSEGKERKQRESESNNIRTRSYHFLAYKVPTPTNCISIEIFAHQALQKHKSKKRAWG